MHGARDKADSVHVDITIEKASFGGYPLTAVSNGILAGPRPAQAFRRIGSREFSVDGRILSGPDAGTIRIPSAE